MTTASTRSDSDYAELQRKIKTLYKIDLSLYKPQQMRRRIENFMDRHDIAAIPTFMRLLGEDKVLRDALEDHLTINVTEFYRDPRQFSTLRTMILPEIAKTNKNLKVWSAGCSTGAEAYTIGMLIDAQGLSANILATDIDRNILEIADRADSYRDDDIRALPIELRQRYLTQNDRTHSVDSEIRKFVRFSYLNLLSDLYESGFDLIVCRNVLIYFTDEGKDDVFSRFSAALKPGGLLFLGATEMMMNPGKVDLTLVAPSFYKRAAASDDAAHLRAA